MTNAVGRSESDYAVIYRRGSDSEYPRASASLGEGAWILDFPEGFACGRVSLDTSGGDYFVPVPCAEIPVRIGSVPFEVPDWR